MRNPLRLTQLFITLGRFTRDLTRLDDIFALNDQLLRLGKPSEAAIVIDDFKRAPAGAEALRTRHRLGHLPLSKLSDLPPDTLGGAFARFMRARGLEPENLPSKPASTELDYIVAHLYETHDLWHVLTGFDTDPAGELGLQAFMLAQTRAYLPLLVISAMSMNTILYAYDEKTARMDSLTRGWLLGRRAKSLVGVDFAPHLARPLTDVRRDLGLDAAA